MPQQPPVNWRRGGTALLYVLFLLGLALLPLVALWISLPGDAAGDWSWRLMLRDPLIQASTLGSVAIALLAAGLASVIGLPIAFAAARGSAGLRAALLVVGLLPLAMPPFLLAAALKALLAEQPLIGTALVSQGHLALLVVVCRGRHLRPALCAARVVGHDRWSRPAGSGAQRIGSQPWHSRLRHLVSNHPADGHTTVRASHRPRHAAHAE